MGRCEYAVVRVCIANRDVPGNLFQDQIARFQSLDVVRAARCVEREAATRLKDAAHFTLKATKVLVVDMLNKIDRNDLIRETVRKCGEIGRVGLPELEVRN